MNKERITELAKQAGRHYVPSSNSGLLRAEYLSPELEKFAELIVKECVEICLRTGILEQDKHTGQMYSDAIKEHFGVE